MEDLIKDELIQTRSKVEVILVAILIIACAFLYHKWDATQKEFDSYKAVEKAKIVAGEINAPVDEVNNRENNLYPKINANILQINNNIKAINDTVKRLEKNQLTKEQSYDTFKNKDINEINKFFNDNGYSTTVIRK